MMNFPSRLYASSGRAVGRAPFGSRGIFGPTYFFSDGMDGLFAGRADGIAAGFEREGGLVRLVAQSVMLRA